MVVTIDQVQGHGGITNADFLDGRAIDRLRSSMRGHADSRESAQLHDDLGAAEALAVLRSALALAPEPLTEAQHLSVDSCLYLVHSRAQSMAAALGEPAVALEADENIDTAVPGRRFGFLRSGRRNE
jgi:hypothetical protein